MKKPEHKRFEYRPRYYNPDKDKSQNFKDRLHIAIEFQKTKKRSNKLIIYLVLMIIVIYLAIKFGVL